MGGAGQGDLGIAKAEGRGGAGLDQAEGQQGLDGRAAVDRLLDIPQWRTTPPSASVMAAAQACRLSTRSPRVTSTMKGVRGSAMPQLKRNKSNSLHLAAPAGPMQALAHIEAISASASKASASRWTTWAACCGAPTPSAPASPSPSAPPSMPRDGAGRHLGGGGKPAVPSLAGSRRHGPAPGLPAGRGRTAGGGDRVPAFTDPSRAA